MAGDMCDVTVILVTSSRSRSFGMVGGGGGNVSRGWEGVLYLQYFLWETRTLGVLSPFLTQFFPTSSFTPRLDRLVLLLDTGSTPAIRSTAAQQIGDVQRQHPDDLYHLLARVPRFPPFCLHLPLYTKTDFQLPSGPRPPPEQKLGNTRRSQSSDLSHCKKRPTMGPTTKRPVISRYRDCRETRDGGGG